MHRKVDPRIYAPMRSYEVERQLRQGIMPEPFIRRMRLINLLSASTLLKIEDELFLPWDVMKIHHMLDELISQDAIIDTIDTPELQEALLTGDVYPLWKIAPANPLLFKAFHQGWIHRFFQTPFDPLCIMLAMRCRLLLDLIDELGHSYNLIRGLGWGFVDFDDVPGEEPGDPGDYVDPWIDTDIDFPVEPVPPPPEPEPAPPPAPPPPPPPPPPPSDAPGQPGYVPPGPGEPGYTEPAALPPTGYGAIGAPSGLGSSPGDLGGAASPGGSSTPPYGDPCADVDDPEQTVSFSFTSQQMGADETQEFNVTGNHPRWNYENYVWKVSGGGGSMARTGQDPPEPIYGPEEEEYDPDAVAYGFGMTYTAPPTNVDCAKNPTIELWCEGELMATLKIAVNAYTDAINAYKINYECNVPCKHNDGSIENCGLINCTGHPDRWCTGCTRAFYNCDDVFRSRSTIYVQNNAFDEEDCAELWGMFCQAEEEYVDLRTELQKEAGCCPEGLL